MFSRRDEVRKNSTICFRLAAISVGPACQAFYLFLPPYHPMTQKHQATAEPPSSALLLCHACPCWHSTSTMGRMEQHISTTIYRNTRSRCERGTSVSLPNVFFHTVPRNRGTCIKHIVVSMNVDLSTIKKIMAP